MCIEREGERERERESAREKQTQTGRERGRAGGGGEKHRGKETDKQTREPKLCRMSAAPAVRDSLLAASRSAGSAGHRASRKEASPGRYHDNGKCESHDGEGKHYSKS